jgi:glycosyltransferase involved in cell wall biosynthesis
MTVPSRDRALRIAVVSEHGREAGGIETYLSDVLPELGARGHAIALLAVHDAPPAADPIRLPPAAPRLSLGAASDALRTLAEWGPDVLYVHGPEPEFARDSLAALAPLVWFVHDYRATCVSGFKAWQALGHRPCHRRLGAPCLVHYYPARCGGLDPATMVRDYRRARRRLAALRSGAGVITHSRRMERELILHGIDARRVHRLPFCARPLDGPRAQAPSPGRPLRLVFVGRLDPRKGVQVLLDALPTVQRVSGRAAELTVAGDGAERAALEARARRIAEQHPSITARFVGWLDRTLLAQLVGASHVAVMPSLWPEPFGRVGLEAGSLGVPAVAFPVGGIPDWLEDGGNGALAVGTPRAGALGEAVARVVTDAATWRRLSEGARRVAARFSVAAHTDGLERVLQAVASR